MRLAMISVGVTLMARFSWVLYLFGAFLNLHRYQNGVPAH